LAGLIFCRLEFPTAWEKAGILEHRGLEVVWDPRETEIKYLERGFGNVYVFDQEEKLEGDELKRLAPS
jgi:hypothetical protein